MNRDLAKERKEISWSSILLKVFALLTVLLLVYALTKIDLYAVVYALKRIPLHLILLLIAMQVCTQLALNYQWYRLAKVLGLKASFRKLLVVNAYGTVVDAANPGEKVGGEFARVIQMNRILKFNTEQSTSLVTIQKILSLSALLLVTLITILTMADRIPFLASITSRILLIFILLIILGMMLSLLFYMEKMNVRIQRWRKSGKIAMGIKRWSQTFLNDTSAITKEPREWLFQLLLSFAVWSLFPIKLFIIVEQFADVHFLALFAITFVSYFAAMIPLLPGGLGAFEGTMSAMLLSFGVIAEEALAISLIFRFITFWFVVIFCLIVVLFWKFGQLPNRREKDA